MSEQGKKELEKRKSYVKPTTERHEPPTFCGSECSGECYYKSYYYVYYSH